ncbi:hypothetical protein PIB30_007469 [Stylosanthes scabra]|uniref:Transposase (Putative), gypsy type n=1 Tax=Stylosanthes scabra TaxID=79078 RepID=A0ABU6S4T7_9FABA|nr:hypothetical protein [Stylosanthes scabra]
MGILKERGVGRSKLVGSGNYEPRTATEEELRRKGIWDSRRNRTCQDRRLEVYVEGVNPYEIDADMVQSREDPMINAHGPFLSPSGIWAIWWLWADVREVTTFRTSFAHRFKLVGRCAISEKFLEGGVSIRPLMSRQMAEPQRDVEVVREVDAAQLPHELDPLYSWVNQDVLGSPSTMTEDYLTELKSSGVICGGGEEERLYRVELPRRGEMVCGLNLEHPRVPHWLWVNEVMFTEFGVRIPFTPFQQRLLQRCFVAPSQFHPNAWLAIRCFKLVTESLELPQDPEVFLYLFTVFSPNVDGKAKKSYMSIRPGKGRKIFGLYEESFHDFKGRYFKVFPVGDHSPFWLTLEGDASRFPSYWSKDAGVNYVPVSYRKMNEEQRDTANVLFENGRQEQNSRELPSGYGRESSRSNHLESSGGQASSSALEGGSSSNVQAGTESRLEVSSPVREEMPEQQVEVLPPSSSLGKRTSGEVGSAQKRPMVSEGSQRDFCPMDRSFDASGYIESNFLGPRVVEALRDYDPMESLRWVEWAMLRSATIMKSIESRLTLADQWENRCVKLTGDLMLLNQQKADAENGKEEAEAAKSKVEKDLEAALADVKVKGVELQRLKDREADFLADLELAKKGLSEEKSRADKAKSSLAVTEQARQELIKLAEDSVKATEDALKEQILVLAPDFDVSLLGAWKEVVDGQIVDPPPQPSQD